MATPTDDEIRDAVDTGLAASAEAVSVSISPTSKSVSRAPLSELLKARAVMAAENSTVRRTRKVRFGGPA